MYIWLVKTDISTKILRYTETHDILGVSPGTIISVIVSHSQGSSFVLSVPLPHLAV